MKKQRKTIRWKTRSAGAVLLIGWFLSAVLTLYIESKTEDKDRVKSDHHGITGGDITFILGTLLLTLPNKIRIASDINPKTVEVEFPQVDEVIQLAKKTAREKKKMSAELDKISAELGKIIDANFSLTPEKDDPVPKEEPKEE